MTLPFSFVYFYFSEVLNSADRPSTSKNINQKPMKSQPNFYFSAMMNYTDW